MGVTNYAKQQIALLVGGSSVSTPLYLAVGSGSGTESPSRSGLIFEMNRAGFTTGYPDLSTVNKIKYRADFNVLQMSGIDLYEFGTFVESSGGQAWHITQLPFQATFDGTNELVVEITWEVF